MTDNFVGQRECEIQHENLNSRIDKFENSTNMNFGRVLEKMDSLLTIKGKAEFTDQKVESLGRKLDSHTKGHGKFISIALGIIALISTLMAVILVLLRK